MNYALRLSTLTYSTMTDIFRSLKDNLSTLNLASWKGSMIYSHD